MNRKARDQQVSRLLAAARPATARDPHEPAPPFFARRVVHRWLSAPSRDLPLSWTVTSRKALAFAGALMLLSLVGNWRIFRSNTSFEHAASESLVSWILPK